MAGKTTRTGSFRPDASELHYVAPLRGFLGDELAELSGSPSLLLYIVRGPFWLRWVSVESPKQSRGDNANWQAPHNSQNPVQDRQFGIFRLPFFEPFHAVRCRRRYGTGVASYRDIRMIRTILLATLAAWTLAACVQEPTSDNERHRGPGLGMFGGRPESLAGGYPGPAGGVSDDLVLAQLANPPRSPQQSGPARHIAVTRGFTLRLPSDEVAAVQERHLAECAKLGCTVLETRLDRLSEGQIRASASVRVAPDRYPALAAIITAPPAEVTSQSERAEDRTVAILDVDKRLEVKTALRDRLTAMLRDPGTKSAADLAAIEKELAQVQGDIEAAIAQREFLRTITETVRVDITYDGRPVVLAGYDLSPIKRAADDVGQIFITSIASLIVALAAAVPWLPVIAFVVWGIRWGLRRWRAQRA
jgi:Domain of unknown function (DUF4349)